jgi:hypothetical protein
MILRDGLLEERRLALCGTVSGGALEAELGRLGAALEVMPGHVSDALDEEAVQDWVSGRQPLHGLIADSREIFGSGDGGGVRRALELAWIPARAVATGTLIPGRPRRRGHWPKRRRQRSRTWLAPCQWSGLVTASPW